MYSFDHVLMFAGIASTDGNGVGCAGTGQFNPGGESSHSATSCKSCCPTAEASTVQILKESSRTPPSDSIEESDPNQSVSEQAAYYSTTRR